MNLKEVLAVVEKYDNSEPKVLLVQLKRKYVKYKTCGCGSRIQLRIVKKHYNQYKHIRWLHSEYLRLSN